jgi:hypothetical protein
LYFDEDEIKSLCLGLVGNSRRFCVAEKVPFYSHCGIPAHGKGLTGSKKFKAKSGVFYVPGGLSTSRATAKMEPSIHRTNVPPHLLNMFKKGRKTAAEWEVLITQALMDEMMDVKEEEQEGYERRGEEDDTSTLISGPDEDNFDDIEIDIEWDYEEPGDSDWAPMAKANRKALELLREAVRAAARTTTREMKELELRMQAASGPEDSKAKAALKLLVDKFGSVAEAVEFAVDSGNSASDDVRAISEDLNRFQHELQEYAATANVGNQAILKVITKMREMANSRHADIRNRISSIEAILSNTPSCPPSPPTRPQVPYLALHTNALAPGPDGNTPLGVATVGGNEVVITANYLFNKIRELQAKGEVLTERSKNTGIIFGQLAFASESEFALWMANLNPSGSGLAGFVDLVSIWSFAAGDNVDTATWLNEAHRAKSVGLKGGNADAMYAHSMTRCYPTSFTGKDKNLILSTMTIKMLESYEAWRRTIMGNGQKERMTSDLQMAVSRHRQYCLDFVPEGILQETAIKTAEYTMQFWNALAAYIEDEYTLLLSFKLLPKHVLLLLSNQVVQICNDMFEFRNCANNVDLQNPLATMMRYAWVTLQALGTMEGYLRKKF